ncbi:helix-turn-helix domain-containing protein [Pseudactinotalea sp. HY158]|uniref:helix-turn-helix domain-containing protein n=1 Tax=Pseudactinotalea sp. HY158 TaxID=2654547 RepID=UPI001E6374E9|nr:helix-turn-helix domain-containing protein [Pseudactinotalea sp. HY158]
MAELWLSADGIAACLGIAKDTVYTSTAEKAMPTQGVRRLWKFQASEIDDRVRAGVATSNHQSPAVHPSIGGPSYVRDDEERGVRR